MADFLALAAIAVAVAGAQWLWHLRRHPYGKCRWCNGTGHNPGSIGRRYGLCTHCQGGRRVRTGAALVHREFRKGGWK